MDGLEENLNRHKERRTLANAQPNSCKMSLKHLNPDLLSCSYRSFFWLCHSITILLSILVAVSLSLKENSYLKLINDAI